MVNKTISGEVSELYESGKKIRDARYQAWLRNFFYLNNRLQVSPDSSPTGIIYNPADKKVWKATAYTPFNYAINVVQNKIAEMMTIPTRFVVRAATPTTTDETAAKYAEKLLNSIVAPLIDQIREELLYWMFTTDRTLVKVRWDARRKDIALTVVSPLAYVIDPVCRGDDVFSPNCETGAKWVIHEKIVSADHIIQNYRINPAELKKSKMFVAQPIPQVFSEILRLKNISPPTGGEYFRLLELWELPSQKYPDGRLVTTLADSDVVLRNEPLPQPCRELNRLPFVDFVEISQPDMFYGATSIENIAPLMKTYSELASILFDQVSNSGLATIFLQGSGNVKTEPLSNLGDIIVRYQGAQPPVQVNRDTFSVGALRMLDTILMMMEIVSGVSEAKYPMRARTATEIVKAAEQESSRMAIIKKRFVRGISDIGVIALAFIKHLYTPDRKMYVTGELGEVEEQTFDKTKLEGKIDIDISSEAVSYSTSYERLLLLQQVAPFVQALVSHPATSQKTIEMIWDIVRGLFRYTAPVPEEERFNVNHATRENLSLLKNPEAPLKVESFQDHTIHIRTHRLFLLENYYTDKLNTIAVKRLEQHIAEHQTYINRQVSAMLNQMQTTSQPQTTGQEGQPQPAEPAEQPAEPQPEGDVSLTEGQENVIMETENEG